MVHVLSEDTLIPLEPGRAAPWLPWPRHEFLTMSALPTPGADLDWDGVGLSPGAHEQAEHSAPLPSHASQAGAHPWVGDQGQPALFPLQ